MNTAIPRLEYTQGCSHKVVFADREQLARAVGSLMGCHDHRFIVITDETSMLCSETGLKCLAEALGTSAKRVS